MKASWKTCIPHLLLPLAVGGVAAFLTREGMAIFPRLRQPPLSPPAWLFPVVWTILYLLMGLASCLALHANAPKRQRRAARIAYAAQLVFNFFWPLIFFNLGAYLFSFIWLVGLWALILATIILFGRLSRTSALLLLPYLAWVTFAGYLNLGIYLLN